MAMNSFEIQKKEFKKTFRGYDKLQVREFLDLISKEFSDLNLQIKNLNEQIIELEVQLRDFKMIEKTFQQTIIQANEAGEKIIQNAKSESQNILKLAEEKRDLILEDAHLEIKRAKNEVINLISKKDAIVSRLKILLSSELELINQIEKDENEKSDFGSGRENLQTDEIVNKLNKL